MPQISLVVCVHRERDLLSRLLREARGVFDDLVVVHDGAEDAPASAALEPVSAIDYSDVPPNPLPLGYVVPGDPPAPGSIHELVLESGGRFFVGPRRFQQEPHWPFAWQQAKHDWILRLDADEFPSEELKRWLHEFRTRPEPIAAAGYTCIWPLWNGTRATTCGWPGGRIFLFNRQRVRFFGMVEQVPISETPFEPLDLVLEHQPSRKSYGVRNIMFRRQAFHWRRVIAQSLVQKPTDLTCWRWTERAWPEPWMTICRRPLRHAFASLVWFPLYQMKSMLKAGQAIDISACLNPGLHHFLLGFRVLAEQRRRRLGVS